MKKNILMLYITLVQKICSTYQVRLKTKSYLMIIILHFNFYKLK